MIKHFFVQSKFLPSLLKITHLISVSEQACSERQKHDDLKNKTKPTQTPQKSQKRHIVQIYLFYSEEKK